MAPNSQSRNTPQLKTEHIPKATIKRLAIYVQVLENLLREGTEIISSEPLAKACNVNASQIRKDLAYFGEFGVRGVGYHVASLIPSITEVLGANRDWRCVLIGVGNLGRALLNHKEFRLRGFHIVSAFDCDPFKIGEEVSGLEVHSTSRLKECITGLNVEIAIVATPPERAQRAANFIIDSGIKGILNFAPARLAVPDDVFVEYVDFCHHLYALSFNLTFGRQQRGA